MTPQPHMVHIAASFDWETLIPIVFFLLYGIAQFLGSKKKAEEEDGQPTDPEEDPMERARQIREEIRRKIEERKQAGGGEPGYDPTLPESQQVPSGRAEPVAEKPFERPKPIPLPRKELKPAPEPAVRQAQPVQEIPEPDDIQKRLREQQQRLAEARKRQQAAREEARRMEKQAMGTATGRSARTKDQGLALEGGLRGRILSGLRHPDSLRTAVLYREILDQPKSIRTGRELP